MHHARSAGARPDPREQRGERVAVGDVAGGDATRRAELGQLGDQLVGAGRVRAAPADQQQVPDAVRRRPGAGRRSAPSAAGAAGDQHGAVRVARRRALGRPAAGPAAGASTAPSRTATCGSSAASRGSAATDVVAVDVDQHEPARVLGLRASAPGPTPPRAARSATPRRAAADRAAGHHASRASAELAAPARHSAVRGRARAPRRPARRRRRDRVRRDASTSGTAATPGDLGRRRRPATAGDRRPVEPEQRVAGRGGARAASTGRRDERRRPTATGAPAASTAAIATRRPVAGDSRTRSVGGAGGVQRARRVQANGSRSSSAAVDASRGVQRGVEQRRVQAERGGVGGASSAARPRRRPRRRAATPRAGPGTPGRSRSRPRPAGRRGRRRRPARRPAGGHAASVGSAASALAGGEHAGRRAGSTRRRRRSGREWTATARRPSSSGAPTTTCSCDAAASGSTSGASQGQLLDRVAADLRRRRAAPARRTRCRAAAPRRATAWSASHGWVAQRQPAGEQPARRRRPARPPRRAAGGRPAPSPSRADVAGAAPGVEPVALVLERVRGQVDRRAPRRRTAPASRPSTPRDVQPRRARSSSGLGSARSARAARATTRRRRRSACGQRGQHAVRAELEERGRRPLLAARATPSANRTGLADVPHPVLRVASSSPVGAPVTLETIGMRGAWNVSACGDRAELVEHRVHQRRVERVADRAAASSCGPARASGRDRRRPRPRRRRPPPTRGPLTAAMPTPRRPAAAAPRPRSPATATIAPPVGQRLHQPAARGDQRARVRQRQHAGDVRGGELADRVADQEVRRARPSDSSSRNSATSTANSAGWVYPVWSSSSASSPNITSRSAGSQVRAAPRRTPRRTPGTRSYSSRPMPAAGALAGEQERELPRRRARPRRGRLAVGQRGQAVEQLVAVAADDHGAVLERGPRRWPASSATSTGVALRVAARCARSRAACAAQRRPRSRPDSTQRHRRPARLAGRRRLRRRAPPRGSRARWCR